jgi:hypothetical protein
VSPLSEICRKVVAAVATGPRWPGGGEIVRLDRWAGGSSQIRARKCYDKDKGAARCGRTAAWSFRMTSTRARAGEVLPANRGKAKRLREEKRIVSPGPGSEPTLPAGLCRNAVYLPPPELCTQCGTSGLQNYDSRRGVLWQQEPCRTKSDSGSAFICANRAKCVFFEIALNALIAASFRRNRANL